MLPVVLEMATPEVDFMDVVSAVILAGADGAGLTLQILVGVVNHGVGVSGIDNHHTVGVGCAVVRANGRQDGILRRQKGVTHYGNIGVSFDLAARRVAEGGDQSDSCH